MFAQLTYLHYICKTLCYMEVFTSLARIICVSVWGVCVRVCVCVCEREREREREKEREREREREELRLES